MGGPPEPLIVDPRGFIPKEPIIEFLGMNELVVCQYHRSVRSVIQYRNYNI